MMRYAASILSVVALLNGMALPQAAAQSTTPATAAPAVQAFDSQQLDALLAPIALYPDDLVTQILMASTFPLEVVEAARWAADPANKALTGAALTQALASKAWDPSVKSIVALPQVLGQMDGALDWMQQVGYACSTQQKDVLDSIQRLRQQAQAAGNLKSTPQQTVSAQPQPSGQDIVVIQPAQPDVVYVPTYNPSVVYGTWPYPTYPPVALPPPPGAVVGTALVTGLAFGAGLAITAGLWGWAQPNWNHGNVNVNVNRYNSINVNRPPIRANVWNPANRPGAYNINRLHPPAGPVGRPVRGVGLPANAIGRPTVRVPGGLVNTPRPPNIGAQKIGPLTPGSRPNPSQVRAPGGQPNRPSLPARNGQPPARPRQLPQGGANQFRAAHPRPAGGLQPSSRPAMPQRTNSTGNAFGGINQGSRAGAFGQRGQQSRQFERGRGGHAGGVRPRGGFHGR